VWLECLRKGWCCCILYKFSWVIQHFRSHFNFSAPNRKSQTKRSPYERMFFRPWRKFHPPVEHIEFLTYHMVEVFWGALVGISPSTPPVNSLASVHEYFVLLLWAVGCLIYVVFSMWVQLCKLCSTQPITKLKQQHKNIALINKITKYPSTIVNNGSPKPIINFKWKPKPSNSWSTTGNFCAK